MSGDPSKIENEEDRRESEKRNNDSLLVKYFSMHLMFESKKIMDAMVKNSQQADYPLLLLYGEKDMIIDKAGCDQIYNYVLFRLFNYVFIAFIEKNCFSFN